jgi:hypothetical protein
MRIQVHIFAALALQIATTVLLSLTRPLATNVKVDILSTATFTADALLANICCWALLVYRIVAMATMVTK